MQFGSNRFDAEPLKCGDQRMREAMQAVAVFRNAFPLHVVEHGAHLLGRKLVMIEKGNEARDRPLEINVVFPQRVVGVDEEGLGGQSFLAFGSWLLAQIPYARASGLREAISCS